MKREKCPLVFRSGRKMKTKEQLLEQFMAVHGDTYDYSQLEYLGDGTKIKIICRNHGEFWQSVTGHKSGSGCKQCFLGSIKPRKTIEQVLIQFKDKHGDRYDYSLVDNSRTAEKVKIICKVHGVFEQRVGMHIKGQGCAACMYDGKRFDQQKIINLFKDVHDDLYDYSQVKYINVDEKVKIACKEHGVFEQTPWQHKLGMGCPKCVGKGLTQNEVLEEFKKVHGIKYDYSYVKFEMLTKQVEIVCLEHGVFEQKPSSHIAGNGCPKCAGVAKLTQAEAIADFIKVHGNKYDYSLANYISAKEKIEIICPEHGSFWQIASSHKQGVGCPICAGNYQLTTEQAIDQFIAVHGNIYDYSLVQYTGVFDKVKIICPEHGVFEQTPKSHKTGSGCPDCAITIEHTRSSYIDVCSKHNGKSHLYLIKCIGNGESFYKVGIAAKGAAIRFNSNRKLPYDFEVLREIKGEASYIWDLEKQVHKLLKQYRYKPMLPFTGSTECFSNIPDKILELLNKIEHSKQLSLIA